MLAMFVINVYFTSSDKFIKMACSITLHRSTQEFLDQRVKSDIFCTGHLIFEKPFGLLWVWGFIICINSLYLFISTTLVHVWFVLCCTMLHSFALVLQIVQCLSLTEFSVFIWQHFTSIKHTGGDSSPKSSHFKSWKMWRYFAWEN